MDTIFAIILVAVVLALGLILYLLLRLVRLERKLQRADELLHSLEEKK